LSQTSHTDADPRASEPLLHASVYEILRARLISGAIVPGDGLSTRAIALELGVSQMPVRDALSRLSAEGAVLIRSKRKVEVPPLTPERFSDLLECRLLLEPEAAARSLPVLTTEAIESLRAIDAGIDRSIADGDVHGYTEGNCAFHFALYRASGRRTLNRLIEALWLQFGPYMRTVYEQHPTEHFADQHRNALDAIVANDQQSLRRAIAADISDGMGLIGNRLRIGDG
jgi:DNA-binding GntR family transcriptional regulator